MRGLESGWSTPRGGRRSSPRSGWSTPRGGRRSSPLWRPRGCWGQAVAPRGLYTLRRKPQKHSPRAHALGWEWLEHTAGRPQELSTLAAARLLEPGGGTAWFVHAAAQAAKALTAAHAFGSGWLEHTAGRPQELSTVAAARLPEPGSGTTWCVHAAAQAAEALTAGACLGLGVVGAHRGEAAGALHCGGREAAGARQWHRVVCARCGASRRSTHRGRMPRAGSGWSTPRGGRRSSPLWRP